jgi:hypothetical protein
MLVNIILNHLMTVNIFNICLFLVYNIFNLKDNKITNLRQEKCNEKMYALNEVDQYCFMLNIKDIYLNHQSIDFKFDNHYCLFSNLIKFHQTKAKIFKVNDVTLKE